MIAYNLKELFAHVDRNSLVIVVFLFLMLFCGFDFTFRYGVAVNKLALFRIGKELV